MGRFIGEKKNKHSKYRGVTYDPLPTKNKWKVRFKLNKQTYQSRHATEEEAAKAYDSFVKKLILNFPEEN